jgi:hypothetical protein
LKKGSDQVKSPGNNLGEFVDVEFDNGDQNALMIIETSSTRDAILSTRLFLVAIISTTMAGIFGDPLLQEDRTRSALSHNTQKNVITLRIPGVTPQNRFLLVKLGFEMSNPPLRGLLHLRHCFLQREGPGDSPRDGDIFRV